MGERNKLDKIEGNGNEEINFAINKALIRTYLLLKMYNTIIFM